MYINIFFFFLDLKCTSLKPHDQVGYAHEVSFQHAIKSYSGFVNQLFTFKFENLAYYNIVLWKPMKHGWIHDASACLNFYLFRISWHCTFNFVGCYLSQEIEFLYFCYQVIVFSKMFCLAFWYLWCFTVSLFSFPNYLSLATLKQFMSLLWRLMLNYCLIIVENDPLGRLMHVCCY